MMVGKINCILFMEQTFIHTSENNNLYLYDHRLKLSILMHPEFNKAYKSALDTEPYYVKKMEYLKKHGFFSKMEPIQFDVVDKNMIENNMTEFSQIVFETTDFCNLSCTYCVQGDVYGGVGRNKKMINKEDAITLLKYILEKKHRRSLLYISFFGGEPLCNGEFIEEIVEVANCLKLEKEIEVRYTITTNATLLNKYLPFLVKNKFELLISLDGNKINNSYRTFKGNGKEVFDVVISNIDSIKDNYPDYFFYHVNFNAVLHNRNSVKDIFDFIYGRYRKVPRIAELNPCDISPEKKTFFEKIFHSKRKSETEYMDEGKNNLPHEETLQYRELIDFLKNYSVNSCMSNVMELFPGSKKYLPTSTCLPFWKKMMLTANSELALCERVSCQKLTIGKVNKAVEIDILKLVDQYNFYYNKVQNECLKCYASKFCNVCIFATNNNLFNQSGEKDFKCENFHNLKTFARKLHRVFSFLEKYPEDNSFIIENVIIS